MKFLNIWMPLLDKMKYYDLGTFISNLVILSILQTRDVYIAAQYY
jgi:hypothetical protein